MKKYVIYFVIFICIGASSAQSVEKKDSVVNAVVNDFIKNCDSGGMIYTATISYSGDTTSIYVTSIGCVNQLRMFQSTSILTLGEKYVLVEDSGIQTNKTFAEEHPSIFDKLKKYCYDDEAKDEIVYFDPPSCTYVITPNNSTVEKRKCWCLK